MTNEELQTIKQMLASEDKVEELCSPYFWTIFEGVSFMPNSDQYRLD